MKSLSKLSNKDFVNELTKRALGRNINLFLKQRALVKEHLHLDLNSEYRHSELRDIAKKLRKARKELAKLEAAK